MDEGTTGAKTVSGAVTQDAFGNVVTQSTTDYAGAVLRLTTNAWLHGGARLKS